ncbi:hypothetical protein BVY04_04890 [bacterium M21]|nr:hypothetical protein BVY04_04890 [bacterium M21]
MPVADKKSGVQIGSLVDDETLVVNGQDVRPGAVISHFKVKKKLGQGAMASVFLAEDVELQRLVAMKFLNRNNLAAPGNSALQELTEQRFIREARSAAMINHPNIAKIYEADFQYECWYIVMEFIDGEEVQDIIDGGRRFSAEDVLDFASQVVSGLAYAWKSYRIIHRDIKPQNIMANKRGLYKLVDLGLAKPIVEEPEGTLQLTSMGVPVGTPYYMAPEQAEGRSDIDLQADIFALGATIHELFTGLKTYNERSAAMVYMAQVSKKYARICDVRDDVPQELSDLVDRMLEPKLEDRINDYEEILEIVNQCRTSLKKAADAEAKKQSAKKKATKPAKAKAPAKVKRAPAGKIDPAKTVAGIKKKNFSSKTVSLSSSEIDTLKAEEVPKKKTQSSDIDRRSKAIERARKRLLEAKERNDTRPAPKEVIPEVAAPQSVYDEEPTHDGSTVATRPEVHDKEIAEIVSEIKKRRNLPALDSNVMELTNVVRKRNSRVVDLTKVIQRDSSLSSNLLSTINSSLYSPRNPIESVSAAVVLLGFDKVKSLAARLSIFHQAHRSIRDESLFKLLSSSYFAGTFTQGLTKAAGYKGSEESFVSGLLHQMPRLILANTFPKRYFEMQEMILKGVTLNRACQDVFGVNYVEICEAIHKAWNLPPGIACSFVEGARDSKSYLKPYIRESCHLADMMFGQVLGGERELAAAEGRIRDLLNRRDFRVRDFMCETCLNDESVRRFFHLSEREIENMVDEVETGVAHMQSDERKVLIDLEQPIRIIPKAKRMILDRCAERILQSAKVDQDINKAIEVAQEGICECVPCDHVITILLTAKKDCLMGRFYLGKYAGFDPSVLALKVDEKRSKLVQSLENKKCIRCTGSKRNLGFPPSVLAQLAMKQVLLAPIIVDGRPIGLFLVGRHSVSDHYQDSELAQVEVVAESLASIFQRHADKKKRTQRG